MMAGRPKEAMRNRGMPVAQSRLRHKKVSGPRMAATIDFYLSGVIAIAIIFILPSQCQTWHLSCFSRT
jgi:hypothetical protein